VTHVLFVCLQNAGRSQMALYERRGGEARSAGAQPADDLHQAVVETLEERGVDVSGRVPRKLTEGDVAWADLVVTMGCGDACPVLPARSTSAGTCPIRSACPSRRSGAPLLDRGAGGCAPAVVGINPL
jgi:protein-tyrosine-phosphatase